jgi:putative Holliday junction resolvase
MGRVVALDYGSKRVGIAVTDPLKIIATPLKTVQTKEIFNFLKEYNEREEIEEFVVGFPYDLMGKPTNATPLVKKFVIKLQRRFPDKQISLEDEKYTSKIAVAAMVSGGMKKKDRRKKENVDKISATIILQSYLEKGNR